MTRIAASRRNLLATGAWALVWCREPAGTGKCQRIGSAEFNERGGSPEVVRSLGEERLGPTG